MGRTSPFGTPLQHRAKLQLSPPRSAATKCQGPHPEGLQPLTGSHQDLVYPQPGQESGVSSQTHRKRFCRSLLPSPPKEAAEILLSLVLPTSAVRTGRIPPRSQEHHWQVSESILPASAGKIHKHIKIRSRAWGSTRGTSLPLTWASSHPSWME